MKIISLIIIACFTIMGIFLMYYGFLLKKKGFRALGKPTINPLIFYIGKIALFTSWGFLLGNAILVVAGSPSPQSFYTFTPLLLTILGTIIMVLSFRDLGDSLRVGLPGEETSLKTSGIYKFSRNPIYVGVDLIAIGSVIFIPVIPNIICAVIGITVHHLIILSEEKFLQGRFGEEWLNYKRRTRRYI
jgi:protein-S-isoprenylcysteine O-methyltransferase Ste14